MDHSPVRRRGKEISVFYIDYKKSREECFEETQQNLRKIEGIEAFFELQDALYGPDDYLGWGDDQIDELEYHPDSGTLTVRICSSGRDLSCQGKKVTFAFWMIDFFDVEIHYFDIAPEHWIDDIIVQQNADGKYSISFGTGELDFRYAAAKVNRCWVETER